MEILEETSEKNLKELLEIFFGAPYEFLKQFSKEFLEESHC